MNYKPLRTELIEMKQQLEELEDGFQAAGVRSV